MSDKPISPAEARKILWYQGNLKFKLHKVQQEIYDFIRGHKSRTVVISSSRRLGKSYLMCILAIEECLRKNNSVVKFVAPETKQIRTILRPLFRDILRDCPTDIKPNYKMNENLYRFPNGSEIQLAGTDGGHAESLRGANAAMCIIDEAGFCSDLGYVIQSILLPTTTTTKGKVILASTPARSPDHEFSNFVKDAQFKGTLIQKTVYDNPLLTPEDIEEMAEACGGKDSVQFRREYLAEQMIDEESAIVPEFTKAVQEECVKDVERPPFFDSYVSMDLGFKDLTVVLFAYYDFMNARLVIEDEIVMNGPKMTTDNLAEAIKKKEEELWFDRITKEPRKPFLRVSDNNLIMINDLQRLHNLTFFPTKKDDKEAALNNLRTQIKSKKIIISPKCQTLLHHLRTGTWNKKRTDYLRGADGNHADGIDCLSYLLRNVSKTKNPYPAHWEFTDKANLFISRKEEKKFEEQIKNIFTIKRRRI